MLKKAILILCSLLGGCGVSDGFDPGGETLSRSKIAGSGSPTVVFESGLGDGLASWEPIVGKVSGMSRTFIYDRPGHSPGQTGLNRLHSDKDGVRTGPEVARNLRRLLHKRNVKPPYLLVGHSIGGTYMLSFAKAYPNEVAGIVLVDGRLPGFTRQCEKAGLSPCKPPSFLTFLQPWHVAAEIKGIVPSEKAAPSATELGQTPITVISSTIPSKGLSQRHQAEWLKSQKHYAHGARGGRFVLARGSSHYIHRDAPVLVVSEIRRMILKVRK